MDVTTETRTAPDEALDESPPPTKAGGKRVTTDSARFTAQLVALVTPAARKRVVAIAKRNRVSQAKIMRAIIAEGVGRVEEQLKDGTLSADRLA